MLAGILSAAVDVANVVVRMFGVVGTDDVPGRRRHQNDVGLGVVRVGIRLAVVAFGRRNV